MKREQLQPEDVAARRRAGKGSVEDGVPRRGGRHLTLMDVCDDLSISRSTFYDWRAKRKAPPCFRLPNGDLRIRRVDYEAWLAKLDGQAA